MKLGLLGAVVLAALLLASGCGQASRSSSLPQVHNKIVLDNKIVRSVVTGNPSPRTVFRFSRAGDREFCAVVKTENSGAVLPQFCHAHR
jgi:hypothetical protein